MRDPKEKMKKTSLFTKLSHPHEIELKSLWDRDLTTLAGAGIINPFGPTLSILALDGIIEQGKVMPLLYIMLNPFMQEAKEVGTARIGEVWNPTNDLRQFFPLMGNSCPTLLLPASILGKGLTVRFYAGFISIFENAFSIFQGVHKFPGDPWKRVHAEMNKLKDVNFLRRILKGDKSYEEKREIEEKEAVELAQNLLEPENLREEIKAFLYAWKGSIDFQGKGVMGEWAMKPETFLEYFLLLGNSCDLPDLKS